MDPRDHFLTMLGSFDEGMMVTHSDQGELHARPMTIAKTNRQGDLWLISHVRTGKVDELKKDARVCVTMQTPRRYLSVNGTCEVVRDPAQVRAVWQESWRVWLPDGPDDINVVLLHIATTHGEFWDNTGAQGVKHLFQAAQAYLAGETPSVDQDQQAKVELS